MELFADHFDEPNRKGKFTAINERNVNDLLLKEMNSFSMRLLQTRLKLAENEWLQDSSGENEDAKMFKEEREAEVMETLHYLLLRVGATQFAPEVCIHPTSKNYVKATGMWAHQGRGNNELCQSLKWLYSVVCTPSFAAKEHTESEKYDTEKAILDKEAEEEAKKERKDKEKKMPLPTRNWQLLEEGLGTRPSLLQRKKQTQLRRRPLQTS